MKEESERYTGDVIRGNMRMSNGTIRAEGYIFSLLPGGGIVDIG